VNELDFLSVDDVLLLHEEQLSEYGGGAGVRDTALLESAVAMAQQSFDWQFVHDDQFAMAAAYAFHIAQNQPLVDGNKRTALAAALVVMDIDGVNVADPAGQLYRAMIEVAAKGLNKSGLAALLRVLAMPAAP
jgi:death on curing protein